MSEIVGILRAYELLRTHGLISPSTTFEDSTDSLHEIIDCTHDGSRVYKELEE